MSYTSLTYHIVFSTRRECLGRHGFIAWAGPLRGPAHPTGERRHGGRRRLAWHHHPLGANSANDASAKSRRDVGG